MLAQPLRVLPGWLFKIDTARVRPEIRDRIELYQAEAYEVLWSAFKGQIVPATPPTSTGAALARDESAAVQRLAEQQVAFEAALAAVRGTQETMAGYLRGWIQETNARLTGLELQLGAGATISEAQAAEIALAVKNIGQALAAQGDRHGYAQVYSAMYRRWGISSYKALPRAQYAAVVDWLREWYDSVHPDPATP